MFLEPAVSVPVVAVAVDVTPVIVSFVINSLPFVIIYVIGFVVFTTTAFAPLDAPWIVSPFWKVPDTPVTVNCGRTGFVLVSSESRTAYSL